MSDRQIDILAQMFDKSAYNDEFAKVLAHVVEGLCPVGHGPLSRYDEYPYGWCPTCDEGWRATNIALDTDGAFCLMPTGPVVSRSSYSPEDMGQPAEAWRTYWESRQ